MKIVETVNMKPPKYDWAILDPDDNAKARKGSNLMPQGVRKKETEKCAETRTRFTTTNGRSSGDSI